MITLTDAELKKLFDEYVETASHCTDSSVKEISSFTYFVGGILAVMPNIHQLEEQLRGADLVITDLREKLRKKPVKTED